MIDNTPYGGVRKYFFCPGPLGIKLSNGPLGGIIKSSFLFKKIYPFF